MNRSGIVVIIPAYNAAAVLHTTMASVAAQTVAPEEVVVVDDGSDDCTAEVAAEWSARLPLLVIRQTNAGPAAARRRAVAESSAPTLALLDADDFWLPDHLATLGEAHRRRGGIVCANALPWVPGRVLALRPRQRRLPVPPPASQRVAILRNNFVFVGAMVTRTEYEAVGGFRDGFTGAEDWDLWIRMTRTGTVVHGTPSVTCLYRVRPGSLTRSAGVYASYVAVLEAARDGCRDEAERKVISERLGRHRARASLARAYEAARSGQTAAARAEARQAVGRSARISAEAIGLLLAPSAFARFGDTVRDRRLAHRT